MLHLRQILYTQERRTKLLRHLCKTRKKQILVVPINAKVLLDLLKRHKHKTTSPLPPQLTP